MKKLLKKLEKHPFFAGWVQFVQEHGGCEQCQRPWCDGECECEFGKGYAALIFEMTKVAYSYILNPKPKYR